MFTKRVLSDFVIIKESLVIVSFMILNEIKQESLHLIELAWTLNCLSQKKTDFSFFGTNYGPYFV